MTARNPRLGIVLVLIGAVLFGLNGGVSRVAMATPLTPELFTTLRITGATLVFVLYASLFRRSALKRPRGTQLLLIIGLGLVGVVALQLTYNIAEKARASQVPSGSSMMRKRMPRNRSSSKTAVVAARVNMGQTWARLLLPVTV